MARFKIDTEMAGAFLNLYQPIGNDPIVRSLEENYDLIEYYVYRRKAKISMQEKFISIGEMCKEADKYLTKNYYQHERK
jgi:hypothetical protein